MTESYLVQTDGTVKEDVLPENYTLDDLQAQVGVLIEVVPRFRFCNGQECDALVDEEGKLKGKPLNEKATTLWREQLGFYVPDVLVGDVLIVIGGLK